jgi:hypothetical protein
MIYPNTSEAERYLIEQINESTETEEPKLRRKVTRTSLSIAFALIVMGELGPTIGQA